MFNPLATIRDVLYDSQLTSTEKIVLVTAAIHTHNPTGRVKASQAILAEDAGVTRKTVRRVLHGEAGHHYFDAYREGRQLNLVWRNRGTDMGTNRGTNMGTEYPPSTSTSTSTTSGSPSPIESRDREPLEHEFESKEQWLIAHEDWKDRELDRKFEEMMNALRPPEE